jgi:EmrB/QacA subfamily drug resistance transporter
MSRRWWTLIAVSLASFMTFLDNNVVNVALPSIQRDLHLSISGLEWIVSSYILVFSGLMLVGGRLADVYGRRRLFITGLSIFTAASLSAGLAGSPGLLIASRAVQGIGAAMAMPATLAIISATFPDVAERNRAIGIWSAVGALALALGPLTGGFISQHLHWGWIFLINVPVGLITIAITAAAMRESRDETARHLDIPGLTASAVALFTLTYALIEGHNQGWTSALILGSFAVSAVAMALFLTIENRTSEPMVDLSLFRERIFTGGIGAMILWGFGVMGIYFFTAMYLQNVLGFSPTEAGAAFVPMALCMAVTATIAGPIAARLGVHRVVAFGLAVIAASMVGVSFIGEHGHFFELTPAFVAIGIGSGLVMIPLTSSIVSVLPLNKEGAASAILNASREVSGLLGVTIMGAILTARQSAVLHTGAAPLHAFVQGYQFALVIAALIVAVGSPISYLTLRPHRRAVQPEPILQPV